jgi:hypothetical protein
MILVDTNVISELMRPNPAPRVVQWFEKNAGLPLFVSTMTEAELWAGFHRLPEGKRRLSIGEAIAATFSEDFAGRVLSFDSAAARAYGELSGMSKKLGRPMSTADSQIAAVAQVHGFKLATRNTSDFEHCGIAMIDPWASACAARQHHASHYSQYTEEQPIKCTVTVTR